MSTTTLYLPSRAQDGTMTVMNKSAVILQSVLLAGFAFAPMSAAAQGSGSSKLPDEPPAKTQGTAPATPSPFKDQKEKTSYAIGAYFGRLLQNQAMDPTDIDPNILLQGLKDAMAGKPQMTEDEQRATLMQLQSTAQAKMAEKHKTEGAANQKEGETFLAANKTKEGVVTLPSGLEYKVLTAGTGPKPTASDTVSCNYRGTFINGTEFDSSYKRGQPASFKVGGVIKGWTEALQLMPVGSKWQLFIPSSLAYGDQGAGRDIPPDETLIFEVELLAIQPKDNPPPTPK
ncbi:MAG TPA: FKBP-type peptidyl-prolyl cis-trans isomerase [Candidatus Angelobacter sp.]